MTLLRTRRLSAWIAIFAMALAALAPTVSRALVWGSSHSASWVEVCSASGMQWMALDAAASQASSVSGAPGDGQPAAGNPLDHCPFCLLSADRLGPPSSLQSAFHLHGEAVAPAARRAPLFRSQAPLAAQARGPPLHTVSPSLA